MNKYTETEILLIEPIPEEDEDLHPTNLSQYLSRLAFILIVLGCLFFIPSSTVKAQGLSVTFNNYTSNPISIAFKYYDAYCRCWETRGWAHIQPGTARTFGSYQTTSFFHITDPYTGRWWGPLDHYSSVSNLAFQINDRQNSGQLPGYYQTPFIRIDGAGSGYNPVFNIR